MLKYFKLKNISIGIVCFLFPNFFLLCQTLENEDTYPKSELKENISVFLDFRWNCLSLEDSIDNNETMRFFLFPSIKNNNSEYVFSDTLRNCVFSLALIDIKIETEQTYYLLVTKKGFKSQLFTVETKLPRKKITVDGYSVTINLIMQKGIDDSAINVTGKILFDESRIDTTFEENPYYYVPVKNNIPE